MNLFEMFESLETEQEVEVSSRFYVYGYYFRGEAFPRWIGKGTRNRAWRHLEKEYLNLNDRWHRFLKRSVLDGFLPEIRIIVGNLAESEAFNLERKLIKEYGRVDLRTGCLYNATEGGEGCSGLTHSQETKLRISENKIGKPSGRKGEKVTEEIKEKLRRANTCRPVVAKWENGQVYKIYPSINSVKNDGFSVSKVFAIINKQGRAQRHQDLIWEYV